MTPERKTRAMRRPLIACLSVVLVLTACSDVDVEGAMTDIVLEEGERVAAEAVRQAEAEAEAARAEAETLPIDASTSTDAETTSDEDPAGSTEDTAIGLASGGSTVDDDPDDADEDGLTAEELDPGDFPGDPADVSQGTWTVAQADLGIRVRDEPAGQILGFIMQPDTVQSTGRGRILNNVEWGEVLFANGDLGWVSLSHLAGSTSSVDALIRPMDGTAPSRDPITTAGEEAAGDRTETAAGDDNADTGDTNDSGETEEATNEEVLTPLSVQLQGAFVSNRTATLDLYQEPSLNSTVITTASQGDQVVIISTEGWRNGNTPFILVTWEGTQGWVDGGMLDVPR